MPNLRAGQALSGRNGRGGQSCEAVGGGTRGAMDDYKAPQFIF